MPLKGGENEVHPRRRTSINNNGFPIQNYYLRVIGKDAQGRLVNKTMSTVFKDHGDAYVQTAR